MIRNWNFVYLRGDVRFKVCLNNLLLKIKC